RIREREITIDGQLAGTSGEIMQECTVLLDGRPYPVAIRPDSGGYRVELDEKSFLATTEWEPGRALLTAPIDEHAGTVQIERLPGATLRLMHRGLTRLAQTLPRRAAELLALMPEKRVSDTSRLVLSPMPGLLSAIHVVPGQEIKAGEPLAVIEAMKMENVL